MTTGAKKTHWARNTLIVLIICGLLGSILAAVMLFTDTNRTYAASSVLFSFDGAAEGLAPNGYRFDVNGFTSDEVLNAALEASGLSGTYTAEQIRDSLSVTGVYPEKIAEQMTKYVSLLETTANTQAAVTDYHATQYSIELYNNFDNRISSGALTGLLKEIVSAYRGYFAKTYAPSLEQEDPIANLSEYDYAQQLEEISQNVSQQSRYAQELADMVPEFMFEDKSFGDIAVRYQSLQSDIDRLNATITLNAVSKDRERLQKRYEMEIRFQNIELASLTDEMKQIEEQVRTYDKDGIIYISANGSLSQVGSNASDTYDDLVARRKRITDSIAETNAVISLYQARLDDMTGAVHKTENLSDGETDASAVEELTEKEKQALMASVEQKIEALTAKKNAIVIDFTAMLDAYSAQEINEKTVSVAPVRYKTPSLLSGAYIKMVLKTAGPLCAIGFMVCMVLLILSRRKETKAKM